MKWHCNKYRQWIVQSLSEPLTHEKEEKLHRHLQTCQECQSFQANAKAAYALLQTERDIPVPEEQKLKVLFGVEEKFRQQQVRQQTFVFKSSRLARGVRIALAAASLAFVLSMGKLIMGIHGTGANSDHKPETVVIQSAGYQGKAASFSVFELTDQKTIFVWIE